MMKAWPQIYACKYTAEVSQLFQGTTLLLKSSPTVLSEFPHAVISILQCHRRTDQAESCPESMSCWQVSSVPWYGLLYWLLEVLGNTITGTKSCQSKGKLCEQAARSQGASLPCPSSRSSMRFALATAEPQPEGAKWWGGNALQQHCWLPLYQQTASILRSWRLWGQAWRGQTSAFSG